MPPDVRVRRVYDEPSAGDGARVLVDRVWPRGLRKDAIREEGGEAACFAHLVCPECGSVTAGGHRPGCGLGEHR